MSTQTTDFDIKMNSETVSVYQKRVNNGRVFIHVLVALFGISAWIGVNGVFIQLPILLNVSPEGWALPSYVVIVIQSANIGAILYLILTYFQCKFKESWCILSVLTSGTIAMLLTSFFYDTKTIIGGAEHSLVLLILVFFTALVGCTSSILFMPYLRNFSDTYIVSYFIGEGLSGVLPSVLALVQGIGYNAECIRTANNSSRQAIGKPRFAPRDYFLSIFSILCLSLVAFIILEYSSFVRNRRNESKRTEKTLQTRNYTFDSTLIDKCAFEGDQSSAACAWSNTIKCYLLILLALFCFLGHGFLPSVQSYSCLPYGNIAYQLSITLAQLANPIACLIGFSIVPANDRLTKVVTLLSVISLAITCYVIYLAVTSPVPPLQHHDIGLVLAVISWTVLFGLISYIKLVIVSTFKQIPIPKMLFYVGIVMQAGSASGAMSSFVLVSFTNVFKAYDPCASVN